MMNLTVCTKLYLLKYSRRGNTDNDQRADVFIKDFQRSMPEKDFSSAP